MNILVDGRPFIRTSAGISTVLRCALITWAKLRIEDKFYVVLAKPMHPSMNEYVFPENVKWILAHNWFFRHLPNICYTFIMTPFIIRKYDIDVYYSPVPTLPYFIPKNVKTVVAVNDVVNLEFAETMYLKNKIANMLFFKYAVNAADILWTISDYTKTKVELYFPKRKCKDIFVGCSIDNNLFRQLNISETEEKEIKDKYGIRNRFLLFVGSLEPRKNLPFLLEIIPAIYRRTNIQLVVVGAKGWKNSAIKDIVESDSFPQDSTVFCGYVSNEDLVKLYNMAECFVSSSLNEGFGLPQLEAFMCGCPVVTAANSAMIEVARNKSGGLLVSGYDSYEWTEKIIDFINKHSEVKKEEFKEYNWDIIVRRLIKTIEDK